MAAKDQVFRFCVGDPAGARSAIYRLWAPPESAGKADVYFGLSSMAGKAKLSLHENRGHMGVRPETAQAASLPSRFIHIWQRDPGMIAEGELALELIVPTSELQVTAMSNEDPSDPRIKWLPAAPRDMAQTIGVVLAGEARVAEIETAATQEIQLLTTFRLGTGDHCLVLAGIRPIADQFRRDIENRKDGARAGSTPLIGPGPHDAAGNRTIVAFSRGTQGAGWIETNLLFDYRLSMS